MEKMDSILRWSSCGKIKFALEQNRTDEALDVLMEAFVKHESISVFLKLPDQPEAVAEVKEFFLEMLKDSLMVLAIDEEKDRVVGISAINVQQIEDEDKLEQTFRKAAKKCRHKVTSIWLNTLYDCGSFADICQIYKVSCLVEIMYLAVLPQYCGRKIAKTLMEASIDVAKGLKSGQVAYHKKKPEVLTFYCTGPETKHFLEVYNFKKIVEVKLEDILAMHNPKFSYGNSGKTCITGAIRLS